MNYNQIPAFSAALGAVPHTEATGASHLRLVWSARFRPVGASGSPWERLSDLLRWYGFIEWLEQDLRDGA